jgi:hypothetical protein
LVNRLSVVAAGAALFLFFVANLGTRGFPLTHVERVPRSVPTETGPDGISRPRFVVEPAEVWNNRALAFNVAVGVALTLAAARVGSEVARRVSEPAHAEALQPLPAGAGVVDEHEDARDRHEQPG